MNSIIEICKNPNAKALGINEEFLKTITGTRQFGYKELVQALNDFATSTNFAKVATKNKIQIDLTSFVNVLKSLQSGSVVTESGALVAAKGTVAFENGAEWTLRYINNHVDEFAGGGKKLYFEVVEDAVEKIRRVDLEVVSGRNKIFYEFKSVQKVPPSHFIDQFSKDLMLASDLSQIKWVFDGKKVPAEEDFERAAQLRDEIKKLELTEEMVNGLRKGSKEELLEDIIESFDTIFIIG